MRIAVCVALVVASQFIAKDRLTGTTPSAAPVSTYFTGTTRPAATCSQANVQAQVNASSDRDIVTVPAGSCAWASSVDVINKTIKLQGAGAGSTIIAGRGVKLYGSNSRVTGFTFNLGSSQYLEINGGRPSTTAGCRIDHNTIAHVQAEADTAVQAQGEGNGYAGEVNCLIDHNTMTYARVVYFGSVDDASNGKSGNIRWSEDLNWGTYHGLYIEENAFVWTAGSAGGYINAVDGNWGCRNITRYNTFLNGRIEAHALQGDNSRGCRLWESYGNAFTNNGDPSYRQWLFRAGTGVVFDETSDGGALNTELYLDNARSHEGSIANTTQVPGATSTQNQVPVFGMCGFNGTAQANGNSFVDGNTVGQFGWPCRDQIGRSTDASLWGATTFPNPAPAQASQPAYIFHNLEGGSTEVTVRLNCEGNGIPCTHQSVNHIVANRDYYILNASFNGSSGVGRGTLATMNGITSCTNGVGFWATDGGRNWKTSNGSGNDGGLYVCSSNSWVLTYTPYDDPHPLIAATGGAS